MKKLINVRLSLVCVVSLVLGIFSFYKFLFANIWYLVASLLLIFVVALFLMVFKSKYLIFCLVAALFVGIGFGLTYLQYYQRSESEIVAENGILSGRVTDIGKNGNENHYIYLENCEFEGRALQGKVKVYIYETSEFSTGSIVTMGGTLRQCYAFTPKMNTSDCVKYRVYYTFDDTYAVVTVRGNLTLGETVRKYVYDTTSQYMPQNADVAYALLTGDRNAMDESKKEAFIDAGIIHLLVVSGLHVGFVVSIFGFVIKRLKFPVWAELVVLLVPIGFYAYICDFSPSVMRAVIMTIVLYFSKIIHGRYDLLTSLCWAALFILVIQPLYLFDVGFQLSVMSVYGIATLYLQADRIFSRYRIPKILRWLVNTLSMSFSCVISTMFISAYTFQTAVLLGIAVNILAIPLVFVSFAVCLFGMIPWFSSFAPGVADKILQAVVDVAYFAQNADAVLSLKSSAWAIPVCAILLFIIGGYVNLGKIQKVVACGICGVLSVICVLSASVPQNCQNAVGVFVGYDNAVIVATSEDNSAVMVGSFDDIATERAIKYLSDKKVESLCLFVTDAENVDTIYVEEICADMPVLKVYYMDSGGNTVLENFLVEREIPIINMQFNSVVGKTVTVQSVYDGGLAGAVVKTGDISVATVLGDVVKTQNFARLRTDVNIYAVTCAQEYYSEMGFLTISRFQEPISGNFGTNKFGNFTIVEKHGIIKLNFVA